MNLYNPFRRHIAVLPQGRYVVRRWSILQGWLFMDKRGYWWSTFKGYFLERATHATFKEAAELLVESGYTGTRVTKPRRGELHVQE